MLEYFRKNRSESTRILYIQYTNPAGYPPLEHSSFILANSGWQVLFLGTGAQGAGSLRFQPHKDIQVRQMPFCPAGWRQKVHYLQFCLWIMFRTVSWRPLWVYASDIYSAPIALLLSYFPGISVVYHEHDSPAAGRRHFLTRLCLSARKRLANRVEVSILPNHQRVKTYIDETRAEAPVICVWNCPAIEDVSPPQPPLGNNDIWILYHGSIVPSRLPATVLRALALLPNQVKLRVVGYETVGHLGYVCSLQQLAHELGVDARVQFLGAVPMREQLLELCHQSHIGIAFMPKNSHDMNEQNMVGASNKPFDYMSCGLALLVSDLPDWQEMYVEPGYGLSCDSNDPVSIANAVRMFIDDPDLMRSMGEKGRQKILSHWNYARQFLPVFTRLNENRK